MREEKGEREEPLQAMEPKKRSEKQRAGDRMREKSYKSRVLSF